MIKQVLDLVSDLFHMAKEVIPPTVDGIIKGVSSWSTETIIIVVVLLVLGAFSKR